MLFSGNSNRPRCIQYTMILIAVLTTHIVVLQNAWDTQRDKKTRPQHPFFLDTYTVQSNQNDSKTPITQAVTGKTTTLEKTVEKTVIARSSSKQSSNERQSDLHRKNSSHKSVRQPSVSTQKIIQPVTHANFLKNPPPPYPRMSRRLGEQGRVVLAVEIDVNGIASQAMISNSSGYPRLDRAALETVFKWRFIAGKIDGMPQKMWIKIPINFILE